MPSKNMRIDMTLVEEIQRIAELNKLKVREASEELAKFIKANRNRKIKKEIVF